MIESENLRTASLYINNQLLSRGLLRDGQSIDFSHPGETDGEVADTMSRIMSVVNDLILRRDRDAEHRESLSATLRTLRAESLRQANDIQRLQEKNAEAHRKVGLSDAAEASMRVQLKTAEGTIHRLKEEAARTKLLAAQTRSACATEVRKRDRQIEGLKKAVTEAARARGASKSPGITTITVVGDIGSDAVAPFDGSSSSSGNPGSDNYDLRQETNAFLAELAKGLGDENEGLLNLIRRTTNQLKDMSGWDAVNGITGERGDGHALSLPANSVEMQIEIDAVLDHLRIILTNPSFVPIEEVVVREDEINRLRDGWEKMETRWKEAVHLIDGWRKRMQANGRPINVEELKMGLRLSPVKVRDVEETTQGGLALHLDAVPEGMEDVDFLQESAYDEGSLNLVPAHGADELDDSDNSSIFDDHVDMDELDAEEPNVEILQQSSAMYDPSPSPSRQQNSPLRDHFSSGNRGGSPAQSLRRRPNFTAIADESTRHRSAPVEDPQPPTPPPHAEKSQSPSKRPPLSLRTVPPDEADASLPASAVNSTPDTSISLESLNINRPTEEQTVTQKAQKAAKAPPATKTSAPSARTRTTTTTTTATATQRRPAVTTRSKSSQEITRTKPPSRQQDRAADDNSVPKKRTPTPTVTSRDPTAKKVTSRPPVTRPPKPPITRGRSETRKAADPSAPSKAPTRNTSATSTTSTRSAVNRTSATSNNADPNRSPKRVNSRLPLPRNTPSNGNLNAAANEDANLAPKTTNALPAPQQSPLSMATIQAKLAASERDADAARVRAKLRAARQVKGISLPPPQSPAKRTVSVETTKSAGAVLGGMVSPTESSFGEQAYQNMEQVYQSMDIDSGEVYDEDDDDDVFGTGGRGGYQVQAGADGYGEEDELAMSGYKPAQVIQQDKVRKRERRRSGLVKVDGRRRSTLSPWEFEELMKGGSSAGSR